MCLASRAAKKEKEARVAAEAALEEERKRSDKADQRERNLAKASNKGEKELREARGAAERLQAVSCCSSAFANVSYQQPRRWYRS